MGLPQFLETDEARNLWLRLLADRSQCRALPYQNPMAPTPGAPQQPTPLLGWRFCVHNLLILATTGRDFLYFVILLRLRQCE